MEVIKIEGGRPLNGTVRIDSAKNSTVALIPAAILGFFSYFRRCSTDCGC